MNGGESLPLFIAHSIAEPPKGVQGIFAAIKSTRGGAPIGKTEAENYFQQGTKNHRRRGLERIMSFISG
jgi:hypothetical protein